MLTKIFQLNNNGYLTVGGTSAGTAVQSSFGMLTGGESYEALKDGSFSSEPSNPDDLSYDIEGGLGLFKTTYLDTHFGARGR